MHNLWSLLAPCGRRTSVDRLARMRLAVDASIWLIQFIKAMRDEKGEMLRNAPLLGLFRRLVKLLGLKVRPVLVFDGATPALKRRTVARRQAFRQRQEGSLRRTAERILLNQMKGRQLLHGIEGAARAAAGGSDDTAAAAASSQPLPSHGAAAAAVDHDAQFAEDNAWEWEGDVEEPQTRAAATASGAAGSSSSGGGGGSGTCGGGGSSSNSGGQGGGGSAAAPFRVDDDSEDDDEEEEDAIGTTQGGRHRIHGEVAKTSEVHWEASLALVDGPTLQVTYTTASSHSHLPTPPLISLSLSHIATAP